ncbi:MAG: DUF2961 domain-containing protein [Fimbriimonadaceae bacterium]|nr:DUF2961 domain-containing protein [Fimbriimonadaceae bacterium]
MCLRLWLCCLLASAASGDDLLESLTRPLPGRSRRASSTNLLNGRPRGDAAEASNFDNSNVAPGATKVLLDERGPGVITHLWLTFLGPEPQGWAREGSASHQDMLLRVTWDGRSRPAVEAPVGDFFANCFGRRSEVISTPVVVEDADSYNCFWRMPFREHAKIEIVNQGSRPISLLYYNIDWIQLDQLPAETPYFHAQYRQEYPVASGQDYVVLDTRGRGHYVGTVLAVRTRSPSWFGEGDEKVYVDGEAEPSIWGTGTEDYFLSAWGLQRTSTPCFGVPYFDQWGIIGGHTSAYRWHLQDPIVFQTGLKVTFEHYGWISADENPDGKVNSWNERQDDYASVAFWYQTGESTFAARAPSGPERRLPSLDRLTVYASDHAAESHSPGEAFRQQLALYPGPQLLFKPADATEAWLRLPFRVERSEPLRLLLQVTRSYDFGIWQAYLNDVKVGAPFDCWSEQIADQEVHLLDFWPAPGEYVLKLVNVGRNPRSSGNYLGLESLRLRERRPRVAEYGRDKDKDWRVAPGLYR